MTYLRFNLIPAYLLAALILMLGNFTSFAQQTNTLETYKTALQRQEQGLLAQYGNTLETLMKSFKQKGDLDSVLIVETEIMRFDEAQTVLAPAEAKDAFRPAVEAYNKASVDLLKKYVVALDGLVKKLVMADSIEEAKEAKAEKERASLQLANAGAMLPKPAEKTMDNASPNEVKPNKLLGHPDAQAFGGHHYETVLEKVTWQQAKKACEKMGGHLVIITSKEENDFAFKLVGANDIWIGCTDQKKEGDWRWVDGTKMSFKNWRGNEPDNAWGGQHYGIFLHDATWGDIQSSWPTIRGYICEWDK